MDPITIAMALAQFAPHLIKMITGNDKAAQVADKVIDIAKVVTGRDSGEQAIEVLKADPAKVIEFQMAVMNQKHELEMAYLSDTASARGRDVELAKAGIRNHRASALAAGAAMLVIFCLFITVWATNMDDFAKATITLILGRSLGWIEQVFSFEFGTTRASRTKDDTISNLTR